MALIDDAFALVFTSSRSIGTLMPHVTVREVGKDEMVITEHPVETGAPISDHAFLRNAEVEMTVGWSDSTAAQSGYCREVYAELLELQRSRQPFDVFTGKRAYTSMLLSGITQETNPATENVLMVQARLREIKIVSTQTTSAPASAQASPQKTNPTTDVGPKQLQPSTTTGFASPTQRQ